MKVERLEHKAQMCRVRQRVKQTSPPGSETVETPALSSRQEAEPEEVRIKGLEV